MIHKVESAARNYKSDACRAVPKGWALITLPTRCEPKYITVARQIVPAAMCETPFLVSTQAADITAMIPYEDAAKRHACSMAKGIMNAYLNRFFIISSQVFGKVGINLSKPQKVGEVGERLNK